MTSSQAFQSKISTSQLLHPSVIRRRFSSSVSHHRVKRFFIDNLPSFNSHRFSSSVSCHCVGRFFTSNMILLRLISFATGLGCSHLSPGFLPHSTSLVGRFFTRFPFLSKRLSRSTELASKREGNCNVIATRPTNHMISSHDHSHDLITWSRHVTYELHSDIEVLSISTSASPFVQISSHHRFQYLRYHSSAMNTFWSPSLLKHASSAYRRLRAGARRSYFQINTYPGSSGGSVRGVTSITINKSHWWEPRWVVSSTASWTQLKPDPRGRQHQFQPFIILLNE